MKFLKGLFQDTRPLDQPEGTYRDARNIILSEELGAVVNEKGATLLTAVPSSPLLVGHKLLNDNRIVLFLKSTIDKIGILTITNGVGTYETIFEDASLDFGEYVDADYAVNPFGEHIVYWVDAKNPPRFLNIDTIVV